MSLDLDAIRAQSERLAEMLGRSGDHPDAVLARMRDLAGQVPALLAEIERLKAGRDKGALRALLAAMRAAGWRPSVTWEEMGGRDEDGAPWGPLCRHHTWRRGQERIEAYFEGDGQLYLHILYDPFDGLYDFGSIVVGGDWVEQMGVVGLHDLAARFAIVASGAR